MISVKTAFIIFGVLGILGGLWIILRGQAAMMVSPQSGNNPVALYVQSAVTPSPTPTLVLINESSNLEEEAEKLTPEDFSGDFKNLKEEILTW